MIKAVCFCLSCLLLSLVCLPTAQARQWSVLDAQSRLGFSGDYEGMPFAGQFPHFTASIRYDPEHLDQARFEVRIPLADVDTQNRERDSVLVGRDFFNVAQAPEAHFVTRSFRRGASGQVQALGSLSLNGITLPVTLQVVFRHTAQGARLEVSTTLDRKAFGLGTSHDWDGISTRIKVQGRLALRPAGALTPSGAAEIPAAARS